MRRPLTGLQPDDLPTLSRYAEDALRRCPDLLERALSHTLAAPTIDQADFLSLLRRYRQGRSMAILWDDLSGAQTVSATCEAIAALATECLNLALAEAEQHVKLVHGELLDHQDHPLRLSILGLGKLGGNELNFNSDIDVVFTYRGTGHSTGRRALDAGQYLTQVARRLIDNLDAVTDAGRVWVVDTRLRPFGSAGALVWSNPAMEAYFVNEGRTWERYAWLKARPIAGDLSAGAALIEALQPFIYRRYLDYGIFDSLRQLHQRIDANSRIDHVDDIKRGPGGIRELEFLVQSMQILRGGREPSLRQAGFMPALNACRGLNLIDPTEGVALDAAYQFLRMLENRLQAMTGRQHHHLPTSIDDQARLATLMATPHWAALKEELDHHRQQVQGRFEQHFAREVTSPRASSLDWPPSAQLDQQLIDLDHDPSDAQTIAAALQGLAERLAKRPISAEARRRLEALMPQLIDQVLKRPDPAQGLVALCRLIDQIVQRSAYLALLVERPDVLTRLIDVFRRSPPLSTWITASPQLLDDLLAPAEDIDLAPPQADPNDAEGSLYALARWRRAQTVRLGLAELDGRLSPHQVSAALTDIAERCLEFGLQLIDPQGWAAGHSHIAIIAYGNAGARQLHYESDLDLVFLHNQPDPPLRVVQRLISWMQLPLPDGRLFEIDTRLRPNGRAGLLVSTMAQFERYQHEQAWTWEHQALIRARCVVGNSQLGEHFERVRCAILSQARDADETREALLSMRNKQRQGRTESALTANMTDLQVIAELGILIHAHQHLNLLAHRQIPDQLQALGECGGLPAAQAQTLIDCWHQLIALRHQHWLSGRAEAAQVPEAVAAAISGYWTTSD
jgi:glutamate-ammonia-ligase adenylyltransferase